MNSKTERLLRWLRTGGSRKVGYFLAIGTVTFVAARISYSHIRDVASSAGQASDVAAMLPLAVDGMLLAASLAMSDDKARGLQPRGWARFGFWFGAGVSLACNVASTIVHTTSTGLMLVLAVGIAALAPILLLITTEIMARPGKPRKNAARSEGAKSGWERRRAGGSTKAPAQKSGTRRGTRGGGNGATTRRGKGRSGSVVPDTVPNMKTLPQAPVSPAAPTLFE